MSLLEDVFLEDEAGEAQELERIIEGGDEYDERPRPLTPNSDENSEKDDEAEEDNRRVDPSKPKRVVKNPRVILNPARLTGPRGIQVIPEHFKDFKFKGKGHEKEDLDLVLKKLEHWAYRLYPKFQFGDCLKKIETLGNKRPVMVHLTKIRTDQFMSEETVVQRDSSDDETPQPAQEEDEFDKLLQQQIEMARSTPAPGSVRKPAFSTPMMNKSITMQKATSSPSINDEQRERMIRNRKLAEERRLARLKQNISQSNISSNEDTRIDMSEESNIMRDSPTVIDKSDTNAVNETTHIINIDDYQNISKVKINRSNIIESSDEDDALVINESVAVDVHNHRNEGADGQRNLIEGDEIVHKDIEMNEIISEKNNCKHHDNQSNETNQSNVLSDIAGIENNKENVVDRITEGIINIVELDNRYENAVVINDIAAEINHSQGDGDNICKKNVGVHEDLNVSETVQGHLEGYKAHKENDDSHKENADNQKENGYSHEINSNCHKEEADKKKPDNREKNTDDLDDIMDVDFSDVF